MKALSIQQPWAYAILHLGKDIENRDWRTSHRGEFLIHTGRVLDHYGVRHIREDLGLPLPERFDLGGIVGRAVLRHCVRAHESKWFCGEFGFVLQGVRALPFMALPGKLGFFQVPDDIAQLARAA
jgi:hypothetical protein